MGFEEAIQSEHRQSLPENNLLRALRRDDYELREGTAFLDSPL